MPEDITLIKSDGIPIGRYVTLTEYQALEARVAALERQLKEAGHLINGIIIAVAANADVKEDDFRSMLINYVHEATTDGE